MSSAKLAAILSKGRWVNMLILFGLSIKNNLHLQSVYNTEVAVVFEFPHHER